MTPMRTVLRWLVGLVVAYVFLAAAWQLVSAVVDLDVTDIVVSVLALMFLLWMFDTFRPSGPTGWRLKPKADAPGVS